MTTRKWEAAHNRAEEGSVCEHSADVYSSAEVLWECLTTLQPYRNACDAADRKLVGVLLGDGIVPGLRPRSGAIPNGSGGVVSPRMKSLMERSWHPDPATRPYAARLSDATDDVPVGHCLLLQLEDSS